MKQITSEGIFLLKFFFFSFLLLLILSSFWPHLYLSIFGSKGSFFSKSMSIVFDKLKNPMGTFHFSKNNKLCSNAQYLFENTAPPHLLHFVKNICIFV